jgi:hypothetical protein
MFETGDPLAMALYPDNGNFTGFDSVTDATPADPYSWGATNSTLTWDGIDFDTAQTIPHDLVLEQTFTETTLRIVPQFGEFPDNALLVVRLTFNIRDYGGQSLPASVFSFTTENRPAQRGTYTIEFLGETPIDESGTTARVNTASSPSLAQGFLLFSGDGNNGTNLLVPAGPLPCQGQPNDPTGKTPFDPLGDVNLNTGSTVNTCANATDGSTAVVFEFSQIQIRNGVTVRVTGVNPVIILVQGRVLIESGGRLLGRGDGLNGVVQSNGSNAPKATTTAFAQEGRAVAGGGDGGRGLGASGSGTARYGQFGDQGYFMTGGSVDATVGTPNGPGSGHGNTSCTWNSQTTNNRNTPAGGGGGHAGPGGTGQALGSGSSPTSPDLPIDGAGGGEYGLAEMPTPEAGSGGGAAGELRPFTSNVGRGPGGPGGAGGGFLDLTAGGDILIFGTVDVAGGRGGNGGGGNPFSPNYSWNPGTGGGGGGSGGGARFLTPGAIEVASSTVITAAGGAGGTGGQDQRNDAPINNGGAGGPGRLVFEDEDSVITGQTSAMITPTEGSPGFFRGPFDATRFQGGGTEPQALTEPFFLGPLAADLVVPGMGDFIAGVPPVSVRPSPGTAMLIEMRGFPILVDGSADLASPTVWKTVGHFRDSGVPNAPSWFPNQNPGDVTPPPDNMGPGLSVLDGSAYVQVRITFYLPVTMSPTDPGPYIDRWVIQFDHDQ